MDLMNTLNVQFDMPAKIIHCLIKHIKPREEALNCNKYLYTKSLRTVVGIKKNDQGASRGIFEFVPIQDFTAQSDIDWSKSIEEIDQQLYRKYGLDEKEISFIESSIKPMNFEGDKNE